jgi:hypothetical protein
MWKPLIVVGVACFLTLAAVGAEKKGKKVVVTGTLQTGVVAIGGETTGVTVKTKKGTFELDFGTDKKLRNQADKLNGKAVVVTGTLEVRKGVEVKERKIIRVSALKEARGKKG